MILYKPTIIINRLVVMKNQRPVMDISFHNGLNIIAGENSSGKTTSIRFIAYALGSESINFNEVAKICDDIYLQISVNEAVITLQRHVSTELLRPLSIFWGEIERALAATPALWQLYPFKRSESKESFSQVLFRLMEVPELRGEGGSNITMHQLMRLVYVDQETPSSDIFRFDRFDRAITRAAVGDYLLGIDSTELYELKLRESATDKEASSLRNSIRTIYNTFGKSGTEISLDFLENQIQNLGSELRSLQEKLDNVSNSGSSKISAVKEDNSLRDRLSETHAKLSKLKQKKIELEAEISDSELFLKELEDRMYSLEESAVAESYLGRAVFSVCPSCFTKIDSKIDTTTTCALCKSHVAEDSARSQLARMRNELALQLKESSTIRVQQLEELNSITREIPSLDTQLRLLETEFKRNQTQWRSPELIQVQTLSRAIGAKEQEIKNALELKKLADLLEQLTVQLGKVEADLEWIKGRIDSVNREQEARHRAAYLSVANNLKNILRTDLYREDVFANADVIDIDFAANYISVNGQKQFSASSMVFLRHAFHLALLLGSLQNKYFRYPRLLILDGIEDGGMEVERSYNFQRIIAEVSKNTDVAHQIIMTTTNVAPELDAPQYLVGRKFSHEEKSIELL
jgi:hypothetical protein